MRVGGWRRVGSDVGGWSMAVGGNGKWAGARPMLDSRMGVACACVGVDGPWCTAGGVASRLVGGYTGGVFRWVHASIWMLAGQDAFL